MRVMVEGEDGGEGKVKGLEFGVREVSEEE